MNASRFTLRALCLLLLAALFSLPALALAQLDGRYNLSWNTVDGGGYTWSEGGGYFLGGTIGQPDAEVLRGSNYILAGGFWGGAVPEFRLYLPLVLRNW